MAKTLPMIRQVVRQFLQDEFVASSDYEFGDDELDLYINEVLVEISQHRPYKVKETLAIANKSGSATATTASHLIDTTNAHFVAGDVGKTVYNSTDKTTAKVTAYNSESDLTLDTDIMESGESYYLYCYQGTSGKDLNLSSITGLLEVEKAEYLTRQTPQAFRNVSIFGDILTLDVPFTPTDGDEVFLYCRKVHQLTKSSSTLSPDLEPVLVKGTVAYVALAWVNEIRKRISAAVDDIASAVTELGNMDARITQAASDLTSGRAFIGKKSTEAISAIDEIASRITQSKNDLSTGRALIVTKRTEALAAVDNMSARITQAINDLSSGRALIGAKRSEALTAIANMTARITQAVADLTSGRSKIGQKSDEAITAIDAMTTELEQAVTDLTTGRAKIADERTAMDTAIDNMSNRIQQAINDLTAGRDLINKVNKGRTPEAEYARYATTELNNAAQYLNQSRGYLAEATTSDRYANYAAREIQAALGYLSQARGYLATDNESVEYANMAARELNAAVSYLNQARGYLESDRPATEYANYATRELQNASAYLAQARGYLASEGPAVSEYAQYAARELGNAAARLSEARGYLAVDQPAMEYGQYAARELSNANAYLNKAIGYFRKVTAQLNVTAAITRYQNWANNQLILYQNSLKTITKPGAWKYY